MSVNVKTFELPSWCSLLELDLRCKDDVSQADQVLMNDED